MKNVRVFFEKKDGMRFISHLDMNRFFTRVLRKSGLPIWYTEGFNPHLYLTFALPLSLGFESIYEILDFRLLDDEFSLAKVKDALTAVLPEGITVLKVSEPIKKAGKIAFAGFDILFENEETSKAFYEFINSKNVVVAKKTKKGQTKVEEISEKISEKRQNGNIVSLVLPAGNDNINPSTIVTAFGENKAGEICARYVRTAVFDADKQLFE